MSIISSIQLVGGYRRSDYDVFTIEVAHAEESAVQDTCEMFCEHIVR